MQVTKQELKVPFQTLVDA